MPSFKFVQKEIASKGFNKEIQVTGILTIDTNKVVLSHKVSCNNGKDWWYIVGYRVRGETILLLLIKTPNNIFSFSIS